MSEQPVPSSRAARVGPLFAAIWLFFLIDPLLTGWRDRDEASGAAGMVATVAFGVVYMTLWLRIRTDRHRLVESPPLRFTAPYLVALLGLGLLMVACLGETGLASAVYVAVALVMVLPGRAAAPLVLVLAAGALGLSAVEAWGSQVGLAFAILAASVAIFGMRTVMRRNIDLVRAHEANAALAVENERTRFARDLHDILGHSLTVITVKAELARRLLDLGSAADVERARAELGDLERLSRDALADVRRAVEGYRELTLPGELARARTALAAAEISAELPNSADDVPSDLRELFAWTVREGVTNVIRHSGARTCAVTLSPTAVEVRDDGSGCVGPTGSGSGSGSGIIGLRERAGALGATVVTRTLEPGFSLQVHREEAS